MDDQDKRLLLDFLRGKSAECPENGTASKNFCGAIFDGLVCWPTTSADQNVTLPCPNNEYIKSQFSNFASRRCDENGKWFEPLGHNKSWTNYTACGEIYFWKAVPFDEVDPIENVYSSGVPIIKHVTHFGYTLSLMALIAALIIFGSIKKLRCARNRLHMHLFATFVMRASMSLLKDALFYQGVALITDIIFVNDEPKFINPHCSWLCKFITTARQYFIMANSFMVLMEGVYLHNLMFLNLFSDHSRITIYYSLGWGLPILFIIPWVTLRITYEDVICWTSSITHVYLLIHVPIALSVVINFCLFVTFLRVLCVKLNSMYIQQRKLKYRKLTKSTLILVPLFGIPYTISLVLSLYASKSQVVDMIWLFFDQTFTSFQGFFAATIYCHGNSEVRAEIRQKYNYFRNKKKDFRRCRTISHTQHISIPLQDDYIEREAPSKSPELWPQKTSYF